MNLNFSKLKSLLPKNTHSKYFYTIDFGSDTVKLLINEINVTDSKLKIWYSHQEVLSENFLKFPFEQKLDEYFRCVKTSESHASKNFHQKIRKAVVVLNGISCRALTTSLKVTRSGSGPITMVEKNEILEKLFEGAYEELKEIIYEESLNNDPELEVVDFLPVFIEVDGNNVFDLEGESGKIVEVCYTLFFGYSNVLARIKDGLKKIGINEVHFVPSSLAILDAIRKIKKSKPDCVILDVGGSMTEAVVCFRGGVYLNKMIEVGGSDFTRAIAQRMKIGYLNAEKIKRFYSFGKLKEKENLAVQKVILETLSLWACGVEDLFKDFKEVKLFAPDFYLVGGGSDLPDIKEQLFEEPWTKSIPFKSNPAFRQIEVEKLTDLELTEELKGGEELIPILSSYFYFNGHRK